MYYVEAAGLLRYNPNFGAKIRKIVGMGVKIEEKMKKSWCGREIRMQIWILYK